MSYMNFLHEGDPPRDAGRRELPGRVLRYDAGRCKTQTPFNNKMGYSSVHEHLQTLWGGCKVKKGKLRLTDRPAPPELYGRSVCSAPPKHTRSSGQSVLQII